MKRLLALIALTSFTSAAMGVTVVNYDDGSTYTLKDGQEIYISNQNSPLFKRRVMKNKDTYFYAQDPWTARDYVSGPTDGLQIGSHPWCEAYDPWHEGLTFDMISWQRACDTNNDGIYNEEDENWPSGD